MGNWRILFALLVVLTSAVCRAETVAPTRDQLHANHAAQLEVLSKWCDLQSLPRQAQFTRNWLPKRDPSMIYAFELPDSGAAPATLVNSAATKQWWDRFTEIRRQQADALMQQAESAIQANQPALAFELIREAVRENPDHTRAREILGFQLYQEKWVTAETARRLNAGQIWSDQFGWQTAENLKRYERGLRLNRGRWVTADEDARLHSNIRNGWRVETDHYAVTTNHSLEEAVKLSKRLETLNDVWRQVFFDYYATPGEIQRWFPRESGVHLSAKGSDTKATPAQLASPGRKLMQVFCYRDQQQYITGLQEAEPKISMSLGFYSDRGKTAYFFAGENQHEGTLLHEATHQLFREMRSGTVDPGRKNNFWVVEAVACYMESLATHRLLEDETYGQYYTVGGDNAGRVPAARKRLLDDNFYVPLRELVAAGMEALQQSPRLPMIYSQSTGLAFFFLHAKSARYRPALNEYLVAVYTGRANVDSLEKLTRQRYEELDNEYREFLK